jgi:hypothetical protein
MKILSRGGAEIRTLDEWKLLAPPKKGGLQWVEGRSAMEVARAWVGGGEPAIPSGFAQLLDSHKLTQGFVCEEVYPEHVTRLDEFRGEHRNHDLLLVGFAAGRKTVIGVEGKNDESFGQLVGAYHAEKSAGGAPSKVPERIERLVETLFGHGPEPAALLRYQLLTASVGTLIEAEARCAERAVLVVHVFRSIGSKAANLAANASDYAAFVHAFDPAAATDDGLMSGPFAVPGSELRPLLIGKVTTDLTSASTGST